MTIPDLPFWALVGGFIIAATAVWLAGTRLAHYADAIARRSGLGQALIGVVLLGGITSLPEIAVSGSAAWNGNAALSVNNLLGGFTMQVAVLALADAAIRKGALTHAVPDPIALLQGVLGIILIALTLIGITAGDVAFAGAGVMTWAIAAAFAFSVGILARAEHNPSWQVKGLVSSPAIGPKDQPAKSGALRLALSTLAAAVVILGAGYVISMTGERLAEQSGLGDSFFGAVITAFSTSLPEISTVLAAVGLGRYVMAVSDIFGTNLFDIGVIFIADLLYPGGPILNQTGPFAAVAGLLGIVVTAIYLVGLLERRDSDVAGVGFDSIVVLAVYFGGVAVLFTLR